MRCVFRIHKDARDSTQTDCAYYTEKYSLGNKWFCSKNERKNCLLLHYENM